MPSVETFQRASDEADKLHGKLPNFPLPILAFILTMLVVNVAAMILDEVNSSTERVGFIAAVVAAVGSWLYCRSHEKARRKTFDRLYEEYQRQEERRIEAERV